MGDSYADASALGAIAGSLQAMTLRYHADRTFDRIDANRAASRELQIERAEFQRAYNQLYNTATQLDAEVQNLQQQLASKDQVIDHKDRCIKERDEKNALLRERLTDKDEYIAGLGRTINRLSDELKALRGNS